MKLFSGRLRFGLFPLEGAAQKTSGSKGAFFKWHVSAPFTDAQQKIS